MPKSESRNKAAAIARASYSVKAGQVSLQGRVRIPKELQDVWEQQDTGDRGSSWARGVVIDANLMTLYQALFALSGCSASHIYGDDATVIVGQKSFSAPTSLEAVLKAIAFYASEGRNGGTKANGSNAD